MTKLIVLLLLLSGTLCAVPQHSPQVAPALNTLYQIEETKQLLLQAEAAGLKTIQAAQMGTQMANAAWYPDYKTICINFSKPRTPESIIFSIVFEAHNVLSQNQFDQYDTMAMQGRISKEKYIESIEYIEYMNALKTAQVLKHGIDRGFFPSSIQKPVASTFSEHYSIQKEYGHSKLIGDVWESLSRSRMN